jgi:replicative DNA helicase
MIDLHDGEKAMVEARSALTDDHFYIPAHRTVFTALCSMRDEGSAIDLITLTQWLRDEGLLEQVGGAPFVTALVNYVPCAANVAYYIDIVREK